MTKIKKLLFILFTFHLSLFTPVAAQDKLFTLEDLNFGGTNYHNFQPKNMWLTWWGDQLIQTDVEECYTIDIKTGKKEQLFTLDDINKWAQSDDERYVRHLMNATFPYPDKPLVQVGNRHAVILVDFKQKQVVWQDSTIKEKAEDWNPVSKATAYIRSHQLYVADGEGREHQLTTDGSREIVYGQSVHRNEFGIEKGTFWSPDGQRLAFYRMDQSMVTDYPQVNINPCIEPCPATYEPDKYPMAGGKTHVVTIGVYDLRTHKTIYLHTPETLTDPEKLESTVYFTNIAWSPDSKTVYLFELNRGQNDCHLVSYNAETGERIAELYRETSDKYVEPLHPIQFLPWDDTKFLMQSQRDGYNHLYLYNKDGECLRQLTSGPWVVMDVIGFNKRQKSVIIKANREHPLYHGLYSVNMTGKLQRLDTTDGVHSASLSPSGNYLVDRFSTPTKAEIAEDGSPEYVIPAAKANEAVPLVRSLLSELPETARKTLAGLPEYLSAVPAAAYAPVTQHMTSNNVSAPVNIRVEAAGADPEEIGKSIYDTAEQYLLRTLQGVNA